MGGLDRSLVPMVRAVIPGLIGRGGVGVMVMVGGFSRSMIIMRCMAGRLVMGCRGSMIVRNMIVMRRMVIVTVVGRRRRCMAMVVVVVRVGVAAMIIRGRCGRMRILSRCVGRAVMTGVMRIVRVVGVMRRMRIVGLVFVAHVTPVPQPLCTVFDRETGIT